MLRGGVLLDKLCIENEACLVVFKIPVFGGIPEFFMDFFRLFLSIFRVVYYFF